MFAGQHQLYGVKSRLHPYIQSFVSCDGKSLASAHLRLCCCIEAPPFLLQVFQSVAKDVMLRLRETQQAGGNAPAASGKSIKVDQQASAKSSSGCCS